jgi:DNA gyrase subunit B
MTQLHAGGKFNQNSYKVSGGLHGVGVSVVNALSEWMEVRIWRLGQEHFMRFRHGDAEAPLAIVGPSDAPGGTEVTFKPSTGTFTRPNSITRCWNAACASWPSSIPAWPSCCATSATPTPVETVFHYVGGMVEFVHWLDRAKTPVLAAPISVTGGEPLDQRRHQGRAGAAWNDSFHETMLCFTNNIPQRDGGTHLAGFRQALTRVVSTPTPKRMAKKDSLQLSATTCAKA